MKKIERKPANKEEYYFLIEKLDEVIWAIKGECNDIDCDKYLYRDLLKKRYRPVLEHNFSCLEKLKREKGAIMRILSAKKYRKYRYEKCNACERYLDKLNDRNKIVSFTKPLPNGCSQWNGVWAHRSCSSKVRVPEGWKKFL